MDRKWIGLAVVALLAGGVVVAKQQGQSSVTAAENTAKAGVPQVLMLADMREAGGEDGCAKMIKAVQGAEQRGVRVAQFEPGDSSSLLTRYRVLVSPTVLVLAPDGEVTARFEGESPSIIASLESRLAQLRAAQ